MKSSKLLMVALAAVATCFAVETRFWQQGDHADIEKGSLKNLSLRSDGRLFLAPQFAEIFDSSTPYLWAVTADSKGNLYTAGVGAGNGTTKVFQVDRSGKGKAFADLEGLEVHALAVDSKDQLYAATDPDGKVYRIGSDGKAKVFYDPHQKYIWAMAFNSKGELFVATGDQGEIHRVASNGSGTVFFKTDETHARSLAIDPQDNLIVGTEPGGLILRVSSSGQGFVLFQAPKREVTSVAVAKDGSVYAAVVGNKLPVAASSPLLTVTPAPQGGAPQGNTPARSPAVASIAGGTDVYHINPDGSPRKAWTDNQDVVYAIGFDPNGQVLLGTGNRGRIYRIESDSRSTALIDTTPTQITAFAKGPRGELYAITGNIGKIFRIGPDLEKSGVFESEVLDAGSFAYWGRIGYRGAGNVVLSTRSGNLNHPESNWSPWTPVRPAATAELCESCGGGRSASPSARFVQYKLELAASTSVPMPDVSYVELAYLTKNVAPAIDAIEVTTANYRFPAPTISTTSSNTISLPPLTQQKRNPSSPILESDRTLTLTYAKGYAGVRWLASDENGDSLIAKVEIRGVKESAWRLLKEGVKEKYLSWDTTAFADGEYVIRVTVSDSLSNPLDQALEQLRVSEPFVIDNTAPQISNLTGTAAGNKIEVRWKARDSRTYIVRAEYSMNGGEWMVIDPVNKLSDSPEQEYQLSADRASQGEQVIAVRVTDEFDNQTVDKVVVR